MKAKYYDEKDKIDDEHIKEVAQAIKKGKIAIFPTETVYGIGTNALDKKACEKIYEIKERPKNKALIVLISDYKMLEKIVTEIGDIENRLMDKFWPGPLTIIFKRNSQYISDIVTAGTENVGVRMTSGTVAKLLIQKSEVPIVAPSANMSGKPATTKVENILEDLEEKVDYIIDGGEIGLGQASTVVKVENGKVKILREGKITKEELEQIVELKN